MKHYVEYLFTGRMSRKKIADRDVDKIEIPDDCVGFKFFDIPETIAEGEPLDRHMTNESGWYYRGEAMSFIDIKAAYGHCPDRQDLIEFMETCCYETAVNTIDGRLIPLDACDTVIS